MEISLNGFHADVATLSCDAELAAGVPVMVTASGKAAAAQANKPFCGITAGASRDGFVAVQLTGYARAALKTDSAPAVGYTSLCAAGNGAVCTTPASNATGHTMLVLDVDTTSHTVGFLLL